MEKVGQSSEYQKKMEVEDQEISNNWQAKSLEIVEIEEQELENTRHGGHRSVYVAVGKKDFLVVKWALENVVSPGTQVFLVHVFPPITYISTTAGILSSSQLSRDQMQVYKNEEQNRRKSLLEKYIRLCNDANVPVDTMLVESNTTAKAILELIHVTNVANLVMGTKRSPITRQLKNGQSKGEYVKKRAPDFCEVILVEKGKGISNGQLLQGSEILPSPLSSEAMTKDTQKIQSSFFECMCFSGKFNK